MEPLQGDKSEGLKFFFLGGIRMVLYSPCKFDTKTRSECISSSTERVWGLLLFPIGFFYSCALFRYPRTLESAKLSTAFFDPLLFRIRFESLLRRIIFLCRSYLLALFPPTSSFCRRELLGQVLVGLLGPRAQLAMLKDKAEFCEHHCCEGKKLVPLKTTENVVEYRILLHGHLVETSLGATHRRTLSIGQDAFTFPMEFGHGFPEVRFGKEGEY